MVWLTDAKYLNKYQVWVKFNDGKEMMIDLEPHLKGDIFEPLKDISYFRTVRFNPDSDTIEWENGADFAPAFLYTIGKQSIQTA